MLQIDMPFKCLVPNCHSGYDGYKTKKSISFHKLPLNNPILLGKWLRRIPRQVDPTPSMRICSKHFSASDFLRPTDKRTPIRKRRVTLKDTACPSQFPGLPAYLTVNEVPQRSTSATSTERIESDNQRIMDMNLSFLEEDCVNSLDDLYRKVVVLDTMPCGFRLHEKDEKSIKFVSVRFSDAVPQLIGVVTVLDDMSFLAYKGSKKLGQSQVRESMSCSKRISCITDLLNLFSFISSDEKCVSLTNVVDLIEEYVESQSSLSDEKYQKLQFIMEQLTLIDKDRPSVRYSISLMTTSYLWYCHSSGCYRNILDSQLLSLPSIRTLQRLTKSTDMSSEIPSYLRLRRDSLSSLAANVSLIFDEMYVYSTLDLVDGRIVGASQESAECCTTVLCFMISSLAGKFTDVLQLVPLKGLTLDILRRHLMNNLKLATDAGFQVVVCISDNHPVNRQLFKELGGGIYKPSIDHPYSDGDQLFLLLDPVHTVKNLYNNFQRKQTLKLPSFEGCSLVEPIDDSFTATFKHVQSLYDKENHMSLRLAHKISKSVLQPTNTQRTSAKMAFALFDDSTIAAFRYYSADEPWYGTMLFLYLMNCLVKIVNVKSPFSGQKMRDHFRDPVTSENSPQLEFLQTMETFFDEWRHTSNSQQALSRETFLACESLCSCLPKLANYLLTKKDFNYVLLGKIQSDPIERRFGRYRQMSGANFFISLKQVLDSEKKIRIYSCLKHSDISITQMKTLRQENTTSTLIDEDVHIISFLSNIISDDISSLDKNEYNIIYYVAGYIVRHLKNIHSCSSCLESFNDDVNLPELQVELNDVDETQFHNFFQTINRGGLCAPSSKCFMLCVLAYTVFSEIYQKNLPKFMSAHNHCMVFSSVVKNVMFMSSRFSFLEGVCSSGHHIQEILSRLLRSLFYCFTKNLIKDAHKNDKAISFRKTTKLSSRNK